MGRDYFIFSALVLAIGGLTVWLAGCGSRGPSSPPEAGSPGAVGEPVFHPVEHASLVITAPEAVIYVDPVGKPAAYKGLPAPDLILITHTHYDHLDTETVAAVRGEKTAIVGPRAAVDQLKSGQALANGESLKVKGVAIEAVAAYNTSPERLKFHPKGEGNGYVIAVGGKRIYVSGDTEDVPEMRALRNIDYAFLCMNLPYTITVEQAAAATLEMKPRVVIPYHYRAGTGAEKTDLDKFRGLVAADPKIEVRLLKWY